MSYSEEQKKHYVKEICEQMPNVKPLKEVCGQNGFPNGIIYNYK